MLQRVQTDKTYNCLCGVCTPDATELLNEVCAAMLSSFLEEN